MSQSLWNRAVSYDSMEYWALRRNMCLNPFGTGQCLTTQFMLEIWTMKSVSIPLEQGSVLRLNLTQHVFSNEQGLNPFGTGQCLTTDDSGLRFSVTLVSIPLEQGSVLRPLQVDQHRKTLRRLNPFGTGQCLTTAVGSSSLVRQGLPKPLPNFFRDSESWVLIWLNVEQILTFHLHIKRSKTWSILPEF